jgi:hypothetical protein
MDTIGIESYFILVFYETCKVVQSRGICESAYKKASVQRFRHQNRTIVVSQNVTAGCRKENAGVLRFNRLQTWDKKRLIVKRGC